jgi:hypothetical protein
VVQERALSPRTLHFESEQLFWECATTEACEVFPSGFARGIPRSSSKLFVRPLQLKEKEKERERKDFDTDDGSIYDYKYKYDSATQTYSRRKLKKKRQKAQASGDAFQPRDIRGMSIAHPKWILMVQRYSGCSLTYPGDKLVAISGLARRLREDMDCPYLTGLW